MMEVFTSRTSHYAACENIALLGYRISTHRRTLFDIFNTCIIYTSAPNFVNNFVARITLPRFNVRELVYLRK